jgi:hypothetical protein
VVALAASLILRRVKGDVDLPRNGSAPFKVDRRARQRNQHARNPDEQGQPDTAGQGEDRTGCRKDTRADDSVEDQAESAEDADLSAAVRCAVEDIAIVCTNID